MQVPRSTLAFALVGVLAAACGGSAGATQTPAPTTAGGGGGGAGSPTQGPQATPASAATDAGGGGGGGGGDVGSTANGMAHVDVSGPITKSEDLGFAPAGSIFGGAQGSSLSFTNAGSNDILSITVSADGTVVVTYGGSDFAVPAAQCTTSNWNIGATSASGSFECDAAMAIMSSGATVTGATIKGNFTAHA